MRFSWRVTCEAQSGELAIESRVLHAVAPSHLHFARVRFAAAPDVVRERVLTEAAPRFIVRANTTESGEPAAPPRGSRFVDYVRLGVLHILSGWDHLAFLFGLVLLADRGGAIIRLVTGFTLAHSVTLALAVAGLVHPRAAAVEAVIAFSVALVAAEKGWLVAGRPRSVVLAIVALLVLLAAPALVASAPPPALSLQTTIGLALFTACYFALAERTTRAGVRLALTFAFGLVHGLGFAGILVELALPADRLVPALAGFNLGVELGQLGCLLVAWPLLTLAARSTAEAGQGWARDLAVAGLAGLGTYWLFERSFAF